MFSNIQLLKKRAFILFFCPSCDVRTGQEIEFPSVCDWYHVLISSDLSLHRKLMFLQNCSYKKKTSVIHQIFWGLSSAPDIFCLFAPEFLPNKKKAPFQGFFYHQ